MHPSVVTGSVHTSSGSPIKGARVTLTSGAIDESPEDRADLESTTQATQSDVHGVFRFSAPTGPYTLEFQASGYATKDVGVTLGDATMARVGVALKPVRASVSKNGSAISTAGITGMYNDAVKRYCKTATQVACAYYTSDAIQCFTPALNADMTYHMVAYWKKAGLSTQRAVEQMSTNPDSAIIALAAGKMIDNHDHYDKTSFEMAVMRLCLAGVTK